MSSPVGTLPTPPDSNSPSVLGSTGSLLASPVTEDSPTLPLKKKGLAPPDDSSPSATAPTSKLDFRSRLGGGVFPLRRVQSDRGIVPLSTTTNTTPPSLAGPTREWRKPLLSGGSTKIITPTQPSPSCTPPQTNSPSLRPSDVDHLTSALGGMGFYRGASATAAARRRSIDLHHQSAPASVDSPIRLRPGPADQSIMMHLSP
ncbi:hypothetical protein DFS34DRAFT_600121 [Phlyctochytrium arcticum]|nr:hypothetical protein DFS34DRAFT_600121 [Phlyctochytrium arcticum]